eukprot:401346-Rhodomonas_salina.1
MGHVRQSIAEQLLPFAETLNLQIPTLARRFSYRSVWFVSFVSASVCLSLSVAVAVSVAVSVAVAVAVS